MDSDRKTLLFIILVVVVMLVVCIPLFMIKAPRFDNVDVTTVPFVELTEEEWLEEKKRFLPKESKNVKSRGKGWYTFELEIDGKTRKYLYNDKHMVELSE